MATIIHGSRRIRFYAAAIALAALAITVLAVAYATGPAQAQPNPDLNVGKYDNPQPCGLNVSAVPTNPDEEFSGGHVALFDAYWDYNTQTLNNNLCPPLAEHEVINDRQGNIQEIVTRRAASNIDVNTTVFHAGDEFKHTVTADEEAKYDFLPPAGTEVWWLKQDDPVAEAREEAERKAKGLPPAPEEPELVLGLSAGLFHKADWYAEECTLERVCTETDPLQYEFEAERDPEGNVIPFVVFENDAKFPIWDSRNADKNSITLEPGEYQHYNWVFFPGPGQSHTYELSVHMKGHVRVGVPDGRTKDNWKPLTWPKDEPHDPDNKIVYDEIVDTLNTEVTSEVKQYTIHVGPLHLNEQPRFGMYGMVREGAAPGTHVVGLIALYGLDRDYLQFDLQGDGSEDFDTFEQVHGTGLTMGIAVAQGAALTYGERAYYDLRLTVSDGRNHEDGQDTAIDDTLPVRIQVFPALDTYAFLQILNEYPRIGESVELSARVGFLPAGATVTGITLRERTVTLQDDGTPVTNWETVGNMATSNDHARFHLTREKPGTRSYEVVVTYQPSVGDPVTVRSALYPITWRR